VIRPRKGAGEGGDDRDERGVLIAEAWGTEERTSVPPLAPESAPVIAASNVSPKAAILASVNPALDNRIYFLVADVREDT
jgi:hypothetical protein